MKIFHDIKGEVVRWSKGKNLLGHVVLVRNQQNKKKDDDFGGSRTKTFISCIEWEFNYWHRGFSVLLQNLR